MNNTVLLLVVSNSTWNPPLLEQPSFNIQYAKKNISFTKKWLCCRENCSKQLL
jgi:hypothetical protein